MSRFSPRRSFIKTTGNSLTENNFYALAGLNTYLPDEIMKDNESPYGRNFRIFQDDEISFRTAISKRKGDSFYSNAVGSTDVGSVTSTTGAADQVITSTAILSDVFTVSSGGRLDKITINVKNDNAGTAPLIVRIYTEVSSQPGALLATSSIPASSFTSSYQYITVSFVEAPVVATSTNYWIVVSQQEEGAGDYKISSTTSSSTALSSNDGGNTWSSTTFSLNYHVYVANNSNVKSIYRFYSTSSPETLFVSGTSLYSVNDTTGIVTEVGTGLSASARFYSWETVDNYVVLVNGIDVPKKYVSSTMTNFPGSPGVSIDVAYHKDQLFFLHPDNKVIWSLKTDLTVFESDAFWYVPAINTADKVIRMLVFQDNLTFFTRNTKWILYGSDLSTFQLRESTSTKGAVGPGAIWREASKMYYLSNDFNIYEYNGGTDIDLSINVGRIIESFADPSEVNIIVHANLLRIYYSPSGQAELQNCLIYDITYKQWCHDTEVYVGAAAVFNSQGDNSILVHGSSLIGRLMYGETSTSDLGKPILFDYWTKYFSFGHPTAKHRIKRLYPAFKAENSHYYVDVQVDVDYSNLPTHNYVDLGVDGAVWGSFVWGDGTLWGGGTLEPVRLSVGGQNRRHQIRYSQHGVDNPVSILGHSMYTQMRRPI